MLPSSGPFGVVEMVRKFECQRENLRQDLNVSKRKHNIKVKTRQKYNWEFTVNFVSFENDSDRQKSYESWIESFFHYIN